MTISLRVKQQQKDQQQQQQHHLNINIMIQFVFLQISPFLNLEFPLSILVLGTPLLLNYHVNSAILDPNSYLWGPINNSVNNGRILTFFF